MRPMTAHWTTVRERVAALAALCVLPITAVAGSADSLQVQAASLRITSDPDSAIVFLDGARKGFTPLDLEGLGPGRHIVCLVAQDPASWFSDVTRDTFMLEEGSVRSLHYRVERRCAVMTTPSGAELLIGDSVAGTTPMVLPFESVRAGGVRVRKRGYAELPVVFPPGGGTTVVLTLVPEASAAPDPGELVENGSAPGHVRIWIATASFVVSGAAAAYFKVTADEKNRQYRITGEPGLRTQRDQRDRDAAVSLVAMQVSLALLVGLLLAE